MRVSGILVSATEELVLESLQQFPFVTNSETSRNRVESETMERLVDEHDKKRM